jgi:hypothetical protein
VFEQNVSFLQLHSQRTAYIVKYMYIFEGLRFGWGGERGIFLRYNISKRKCSTGRQAF